jgi:hypothetical protein
MTMKFLPVKRKANYSKGFQLLVGGRQIRREREKGKG